MRDAYQMVTDRIVAALETGTRPWQRSWKEGVGPVMMGRPLRSCGTPYTGINVLNLWIAAQSRGFRSSYWMTYKTAAGMGGQVRKGARSELAFYVGRMVKPGDATEGSEPGEDRTISFLKHYNVFNCDEIDGLPARYYSSEPVAAPVPSHDRMPAVDAFVDALRATIRHGGDRAFYAPSLDAVQMPALEAFRDAASYYSVLLHELTHWTSHASRCDRQLGKRFGDNQYAAEELVAELGAAFLCADLEVSAEPRDDHASYIASWIAVLKGDKRAIFKAASLAEAAATWMHRAQPAELQAAA